MKNKELKRYTFPAITFKDANFWFSLLLFFYITGSAISHIAYLSPTYRFLPVLLSAIATASLYLVYNRFVIDKRYATVITVLIFPQLLLLPFTLSMLNVFYIVSFVINFLVLLALEQFPLSSKEWKLLFFLLLLLSVFPVFDNHNLTSVFGNSNVLSIILLFEFLILYHLRNHWTDLWFYSLLGVLILIMWLTHSRSSLIFLGVFFFLQQVGNRLNMRSVKLLGIVVFLLVLFFYWQILLHRGGFLMELFSWTSRKGASLSHRDVIAKAAMDYVQNHFLGVGFGKSNVFLLHLIGRNLTPHNTFLKLLLEGGLLYFLSNLFLYLYFFMRTQNKFIVAFSIAYGVKMLFESATPLGYSLISVTLLLPFFLKDPAGLFTQKMKL